MAIFLIRAKPSGNFKKRHYGKHLRDLFSKLHYLFRRRLKKKFMDDAQMPDKD